MTDRDDRSSQIKVLQSQYDRNKQAIERHRKQFRKLADENEKLQQRLRVLTNRERLTKAIGNPGSVYFSSLCGPKVAGKSADVLKVNRTRAIAVVCGEAYRWSVPLDLLIDSGADDLTFVSFGGDGQ